MCKMMFTTNCRQLASFQYYRVASSLVAAVVLLFNNVIAPNGTTRPAGERKHQQENYVQIDY